MASKYSRERLALWKSVLENPESAEHRLALAGHMIEAGEHKGVFIKFSVLQEIDPSPDRKQVVWALEQASKGFQEWYPHYTGKKKWRFGLCYNFRLFLENWNVQLAGKELEKMWEYYDYEAKLIEGILIHGPSDDVSWLQHRGDHYHPKRLHIKELFGTRMLDRAFTTEFGE